MDEVQRIRGVVADSAAGSLAYWQAQFAVSTAAARAGDQEAAGGLASLSRSLLQAAEAEAASMLELQQMRSWVAQSLQDTAGYAQSYAGGAVVPVAPVQRGGALPMPVAAPTALLASPEQQRQMERLIELVQRQGDELIEINGRMLRLQREAVA